MNEPIIKIVESEQELRDAQEVRKKVFQEENELDFAYSISGIARFRVNVYKQKNSVALTLRVVPLEVKTFKNLHLPEDVLNKLANEMVIKMIE